MALSKLSRPRLLQDFLIPHLDQGTFFDKLYWVDREKQIFRIFWRHQSSSRFSPEEDSCVFKAWAIAKNLWDPTENDCLTKAKQRLRAALLKLRTVKCIDRHGESRTYQIISNIDQPHEYTSESSPESSQDSTIYDFPYPQLPDEYLESDYFIEQLLMTSVLSAR